MLIRSMVGLGLAVLLCGATSAAAARSVAASERRASASDSTTASEGVSAEAGEGAQAEGINWFGFAKGETRPALGFMFINFAIVGVIVFILLRGPISGRVHTRHDALVKALEEAKMAREEAELALAEARTKTDALDQEMARIRGELISGGKSEAARIAAEADQRAVRMQEDATALVQQEVARMSQAIREEIVEAVIAAAERAVVEKINAADHTRLSTEFVDSIRGAETRAAGR
jgi:F0F1-type ATP synthase membrane subunit b/b'